MSDISETIRSLKPGDRVRVTLEDEVQYVNSDGLISCSFMVIRPDVPVITSIEVIEQPLQVGDRVTRVGMGMVGTITAVDDAYALVSFERDPAGRCAIAFSDLRRAS